METFRVEKGGMRLDHFITEQVPRLSRSRLQALIKDGHILLNGASARTSVTLRAGDTITFRAACIGHFPSPTKMVDNLSH